MINERYVLDASVAAKWFLNDEDAVDIAETFLIRFLAKEIVFYAPHILEYELGHIITRAQRSGRQRIETDQAIEAYRTFSELPIVFCDLSVQDRQTILDFAIRFNRGFYDATYIVLANKLDCIWLTSEKRYRTNLPHDFPEHLILTLESFE